MKVKTMEAPKDPMGAAQMLVMLAENMMGPWNTKAVIVLVPHEGIAAQMRAAGTTDVAVLGTSGLNQAEIIAALEKATHATRNVAPEKPPH